MQQIGSIRTLPSSTVLIRESSEHGGISGIFDSPNLTRMRARIFSIFSETSKHFEKKNYTVFVHIPRPTFVQKKSECSILEKISA